MDQSRTWTAPDGAPLLPYHPYTSGSIAPVTPGAVERYDIEIFPTLNTVAAGHRIRLTITTADSPHLQPTIPETANLVGGIYQVQRSAAAPSSVELPLGTVNGAPATTGSPQTGQTATKGPATGRPLLAYTGTNETVALLAAAIALLAAAALALRRRRRSAPQRPEDTP